MLCAAAIGRAAACRAVTPASTSFTDGPCHASPSNARFSRSAMRSVSDIDSSWAAADRSWYLDPVQIPRSAPGLESLDAAHAGDGSGPRARGFARDQLDVVLPHQVAELDPANVVEHPPAAHGVVALPVHDAVEVHDDQAVGEIAERPGLGAAHARARREVLLRPEPDPPVAPCAAEARREQAAEGRLDDAAGEHDQHDRPHESGAP